MKYIDKDTGQVYGREPEFVKLYIRQLCRVKGLNATQHNIFHFMLENMNFENEVSYGQHTKARFLKEQGIKNQTFNNNISALVKAGLINSIGKSEYLVNKKYAAKVDWKKVQSIRWISEFTPQGTKLDKSKFFKGKKGTYADLTVFIDENESEHGNNGLVKQKADRGVEMPILGNAKIFWSDSQQSKPHPNQTGTVPNAPIDLNDFDETVPF